MIPLRNCTVPHIKRFGGAIHGTLTSNNLGNREDLQGIKTGDLIAVCFQVRLLQSKAK